MSFAVNFKCSLGSYFCLSWFVEFPENKKRITQSKLELSSQVDFQLLKVEHNPWFSCKTKRCSQTEVDIKYSCYGIKLIERAAAMAFKRCRTKRDLDQR
jgi:hypothetical protein